MLPKYIGRDCELSTTGIDGESRTIDPSTVTCRILEQIKPAFADRGGVVWSRNERFYASSLDCLRQWSSNGQCYYADMSHVECATATCLDPFDFAAQCWHLTYTAEAARRLAQAQAHDGSVYSLATSNVDTLDPSISFGTHISIAVEQELWEDLFLIHRHPARLAMVASGLAAAIPFFGAGYLLPMKDRTVYSLSARAHHITRISSASTTEAYRRGMLNSRREPHGDGMDRLHLIGFDFCLPSSPLLCAFLQSLFAASEEHFCGLQLYDPVRSLRTWSWGMDMETGINDRTANLVDGRRLTLPEYLRELTQTLLKMCESRLIPETIAPRAWELLPRIVELTHYVQEGLITKCAQHLTWAAKLLCLLDINRQNDGWLGDSETRLADHDFASTDRERGLLWSLWDQGLVDPLVSQSDIDACWSNAPSDSRDYGRGRLIRRFVDRVTDVDWSYVELQRSSDVWSPRVRIKLPRPNSLPKSQVDELLTSTSSLEEFVDRLGRTATDRDPIEDVTPHLIVPGGGKWSETYPRA